MDSERVREILIIDQPDLSPKRKRRAAGFGGR